MIATAEQHIIVVTGSRDHRDHNLIGTELYRAVGETTATEIIIRHGDCPATPGGPPGADQITAQWCESEAEWFEPQGRRLVVEPMPADWDNCAPGCPPGPHRRHKKPGDVHHPGNLDTYCPGGGPRRNAQLLIDAHRCLAFPLGASYGTHNCMRLARAAGIPVKRVR